MRPKAHSSASVSALFRLLPHALEELLLQISGKLVLGIEFKGLLVVLHDVEVVTLSILSGILYDSHHVEEATKGTDV